MTRLTYKSTWRVWHAMREFIYQQRLLRKWGKTMEREKIGRMLEILTKPEKDHADAEFARNNLDGFSVWLMDMATGDLVKRGVEESDAREILETVAGVHRMLGATEFMDFISVASMFEEEGLS